MVPWDGEGVSSLNASDAAVARGEDGVIWTWDTAGTQADTPRTVPRDSEGVPSLNASDAQ